MRRQPRVVYWVVFLDALLMFAIVPLLPGYVHDLHLSKTQAGLVVGVYSGAVLVFSVPVGYLAARVGARRLTIFGVALLAAATFGCAFAGGFWALLAARIGQGLSSAISWTAALAWLSEASEPGSRGRVLGHGDVVRHRRHASSARSSAACSAARTACGRRSCCSAASPSSSPCSCGARRREPPRRRRSASRALMRAVGASRAVVAALGMMVLVATVSGTLDTLVPLRLGVDGYSAAAITVVLTTAGVVASASNYGVGLIFDRFGGIAIALVAIVAMAAFVAALAAAPTGLALAIIFVASTPAITGQYAVAFPLCAEGADAAGLAHANVFGLLNLAWGAGFLVGPAAGAALAQSTSDEVTYVVLAIVSLLAALALRPLALSYRECQPSRLNAG